MAGRVRQAALFATALGLLLCPATGFALEWGGHLKSLNLHLQAPPASGLPAGELSANRLRLDLSGEAPGALAWEFALEDSLRYSDPPGLLPPAGDVANRVVDLEKNWGTGERFENRLAVDRLNLHGTLGDAEWTAGRQGIGFGRIVLFSPLDVIAPFPPDALDTDVRPGVDALRLIRYFGLGGQAEAVAVFGGRPRENSYLATFSHNAAGIDLLGLAGRLRGRSMAGFGLAGQLGGVGVKGEAALYRGRDRGEPGGDLHDDYAIAALEADYRFSGGLMLAGEYLYNGAGVNGPADYPQAAASAPYAEGLAFLLGRHYLLLAPAYELHPLVTLSGLLIWNLEDDSFLLRPLADLSLSDDLALQLFWTFSEGREPETLFGASVPRSEFGSAGGSSGLFLQYFF